MCKRATPNLKRILFVKLSAFLSLQLHVKSSWVSGLRILIQILEALDASKFCEEKSYNPLITARVCHSAKGNSRRDFCSRGHELGPIFSQRCWIIVLKKIVLYWKLLFNEITLIHWTKLIFVNTRASSIHRTKIDQGHFIRGSERRNVMLLKIVNASHAVPYPKVAPYRRSFRVAFSSKDRKILGF